MGSKSCTQFWVWVYTYHTNGSLKCSNIVVWNLQEHKYKEFANSHTHKYRSDAVGGF